MNQYAFKIISYIILTILWASSFFTMFSMTYQINNIRTNNNSIIKNRIIYDEFEPYMYTKIHNITITSNNYTDEMTLYFVEPIYAKLSKKLDLYGKDSNYLHIQLIYPNR